MKSRGHADAAGIRLRAVLGHVEPPSQPRSLLADPIGPTEDPLDLAPAAGSGALPGARGDRPPAAWRGAVFDPRRRGAVALVVLALLGAVTAGAIVLRARPTVSILPRAVPPVDVSTSTSTSVKPSSAAVLIIDVTGAVRRPGLQRLPPGARVADAVAAAGGAKPGTSTAGLNLARKLTDGEQLVVGGRGAPGAAPAAPASAAAGLPIDLNAATIADLDRLSGVGPVLAQRIIAWRDERGGFTSVDQLREVEGIGDRKFASLRAQVTV